MLRVASLDELASTPPSVRTLLHMVLLMAIRDRARCVRIEPSSTALQMWYCVPDEIGSATWYTLVPGPTGLWESVVEVFREGSHFLPLAGWFDTPGRGRDDYPYTTTLTQQIGAYQCPWTLLLDTRQPFPNALLIPSSGEADAETAGRLLNGIYQPRDTTGP